MKHIWEAIGDKRIRRAVEGAMWESARALIMEYPAEFNEENLNEHISDLIRRFGNRALQDTIYRVGRDIPRKLSRNDRLIGALLLADKHSVPARFIILAVVAALFFRGKDESGRLFERDRVFAEKVFPQGIDHILGEVCHLTHEEEKRIVDRIKETYELLVKDPQSWRAAVS
jgi:mannitol-1-phosphate 5-dehydrogenase